MNRNNWVNKLGENPYFIVITGLCSIIGLLISFLNDNLYLKALVVIIFAFIVLVSIFRGTSYLKLKSKVNKLNEILDLIERQNNEYKKCVDSIQGGLLFEYSHLDVALKPYIDCIAKLTEIILGKKGCICIKIIETQSLMNVNVEEWKVRTIARSQSTRPNRIRNDNKPIYVLANSDFYDIITGGLNNEEVRLDPFIVPDLPKFIEARKAAKLGYKNSTKDYLKRYKSTMVFPIATENEKVSSVIKDKMIFDNNVYYHVIGFLCWDYKEAFDKNDEDFALVAEILASFADVLYPLLENYIVMQLHFSHSNLQFI